MWTRTVALLLLGNLALCAAPKSFSEQTAIEIDRFLKDRFADHHGAIMIGLVDRNGSSVSGAGKLDNGTDAEADADTLFELCSVTKIFTVLLALELEKRREWNLTDPASKHLPQKVSVPSFDDQPITIANLACQDSGLPRFPHNFGKNGLPGITIPQIREAANAYTLADLYGYLSNHQLTNTPGTAFRYSNTGMALLGHLAERRTEVPYPRLLTERVLKPLGMNSTRVRLMTVPLDRLAIGHWQDGRSAENLKFQAMAPAGSLFTSVSDMQKFMSAVLGFTAPKFTPLFKQMAQIRHTDSPRFGRTAMPWTDENTYSPSGSDLLGHAGGGFGYIAFIGFDKIKRRAVIVLSSQMVWNPARIGWAILQEVPLTRENINFGVRQVMGVGIGIRRGDKSGIFSASRVFPRSSAGAAGIQPNSIIDQIDGKNVTGKSLEECLNLLRGKEGSHVNIAFIPPNATAPVTVRLQRRKFITSSE